MIITIPVRRTILRRNGADVSALAIAPGFCRVRSDDTAFNDVIGDEIVMSNPLLEWAALQSSTVVGANEQIFIELQELPNSNPGADDNGPSITHQHGV